MKVLPETLDQHPNWCLSGGADGADLAWGTAARAKGHGVIHFSFHGHRTKAPINQLHVLSDEQLEQAVPHATRASRSLNRRFYNGKRISPYGRAVRNLLLRNWFQIPSSETCYAISSFDEKGFVKGGTAWAVQYFIDQHDGRECPAYVFDQEVGYWFHWNGVIWERIYEPPAPTGIWTGIGTRKLNIAGKLAINVLMDYWPLEKSIWSGGANP